MKIFPLIMAIFLAFATTGAILLSFTVIEPSASNLSLMCMMSTLGYFGSYVYFNIYIERVKKDSYMQGYDKGSTDQYI